MISVVHWKPAKQGFVALVASIISVGDGFAEAHPHINSFAQQIAFVVAGPQGLQISNAIAAKSKIATDGLTDAQKDLYNANMANRGVLADRLEQLAEEFKG